jgi:hypothetical protein
MNYQYFESFDIGFLQSIVSNIQVDTSNAQVGDTCSNVLLLFIHSTSFSSTSSVVASG